MIVDTSGTLAERFGRLVAQAEQARLRGHPGCPLVEQEATATARPGPARKAANKQHLTIGIRRILTRKSRVEKMQNYIPSQM
eukprot:4176551-Prymnesium_polylepis.1